MLARLPNNIARVRLWAGFIYWLFVLCTFVALPYGGPGWTEGGIPVVVLGLPWSIAVLFIGSTISALPWLSRILSVEAANFLLFVILCGGLNAVLIIGTRRVSSWFSVGRYHAVLTVAILAVLLGAAQLLMPSVALDALQRTRPKNVPKDAVHVGGAIGWWQYCTFDPMPRTDKCTIWNRNGLTLENEEFVPYDGGSPAPAEQLQIVDTNSGPDRIALQNGRILIPKSREADLRRFLDWLTGKRSRP